MPPNRGASHATDRVAHEPWEIAENGQWAHGAQSPGSSSTGPMGGSFFSDALAESTWVISYMPVVCGPEDLRAQRGWCATVMSLWRAHLRYQRYPYFRKPPNGEE